jgi:putative ABC transport system permease protein
MIKNYLTIAWRQMRKQKMYTAIKIGGLALGIATCLLIALYIRNELSYDAHLPNVDRMYRVIAMYHNKGLVEKGTSFAPPFASAVKTDFPQVELAARVMPHALFNGAGSNEVLTDGRVDNTFEEGFSYADGSLLEMFSIPMVYGERAHALDGIHSIVLSRSKAEKYFPHENPVGKFFYLNNDKDHPWVIGGVMEDMPSTFHMHYDFLLSLKGNEFWPGESTTWMAQNYDTYIRLRAGTNPVRMQESLHAIVKKYMVPTWAHAGMPDAEKLGNQVSFYLQPVRDIHLTSEIGDALSHGDIRFVWLFGAVAGFILALACINFINLSTARSANRAKEVGLRKVIGSDRLSLVRQFLTESMLFSMLSFLLAIVLAWLLLPFFNRIAGQSLVFPWTAWWLAPVVLGAATVVGLLAGLYPAFYLSGFQPIRVLKGDISRGSKNSNLRSVLVVFQFATSIVLIFASFIVYRQMNYIMERRPGFDKDQVVLIQGTHTLKDQLASFKSELQKLPGVKSVTGSDFLPITGGKRNMNTFRREGKEKEDAGTGAQIWRVDVDYLSTMGMKIVEGRNFSPALPSDSQTVIINQKMARDMQLKDPIGQRITNGGQHFLVIGVMEDFNFESIRQPIGPLCMTLGRRSSIVAVKAGGGDMAALIARIGSTWKSFSPHQAIRYEFMDERFRRMYADIQRTGSIFTSFTVLAVIIACLGLFALSAYMAEQRSKEIGIRKVLGATVSQVTGLLSKDFVKLVLIAIVIASPLAWWMMHKWLQDFAYRVEVSGWLLAASGGMVIGIALLTVSLQSVRAAMANPVKSLRAE